MDNFFAGVAYVIGVGFVFGIGWIASATTIRDECKALGAFYVANTVYECKVKEKNP